MSGVQLSDILASTETAVVNSPKKQRASKKRAHEDDVVTVPVTVDVTADVTSNEPSSDDVAAPPTKRAKTQLPGQPVLNTEFAKVHRLLTSRQKCLQKLPDRNNSILGIINSDLENFYRRFCQEFIVLFGHKFVVPSTIAESLKN